MDLKKRAVPSHEARAFTEVASRAFTEVASRAFTEIDCSIVKEESLWRKQYLGGVLCRFGIG